MTRNEALELLNRHLGSSPNLIRHSMASEAVMYALAKKLGKDENEANNWALIGLLHDLDYVETEDNPQCHGLKTVEYLAECGIDDEGLLAIKRHNSEMLGLTRETVLDQALTAGEVITGLIMAAALVRPDKKISEVKTSSVMKKMKDKSFARGANRDHIKLCEEFGLPLAEFVDLSITAMAKIEDKLGLGD